MKTKLNEKNLKSLEDTSSKGILDLGLGMATPILVGKGQPDAEIKLEFPAQKTLIADIQTAKIAYTGFLYT